MSLVAYDPGSDSDDGEEEGPSHSGVVVLLPKSANGTVKKSPQQLFRQLPDPKHASSSRQIQEEQDEFLLKKEVATEKPKQKVPVRIGIPAIADFYSDEEDDDEPQKKRRKKYKLQSKTSGLFALLPPPKTTPITTKSFIPNVLTKKANPQQFIKKVPSKPVETVSKKPNPSESDDDDDDDIELDEEFDPEAWERLCGNKKKPAIPIIEVNPPTIVEESVIDIAPAAKEPYSGLDNKAFKQLVGSSAKMKKENIRLVDIHEEDVLPERDVWMTKALTDPECKPKYVVDDPVNDTCKKKHHITYLAQQAKANEQELQNQWSQNKYTRKQTQQKYGF